MTANASSLATIPHNTTGALAAQDAPGDIAALGFSLIPKSFDEMMQLAEWLAKSSSLRPELVAKPFDVFSIIVAGAELGLPLMASLRGIFTVNGKTALEGKTKMAICLQRGAALYFRRTEYTPDATTWETKRRGAVEAVSQTFTRKQAEEAGLLGKAGPWRNYTQRMISHRAIGWLCDDVYPDILMGVGSAEDDDSPDAPVFQSLGMVGPGVELGAAPEVKPAPAPVPSAPATARQVESQVVQPTAPPPAAKPASGPAKVPADATIVAALRAELLATRTEPEVNAMAAKIAGYEMGKATRDELLALYQQHKAMIRDAAKAAREASAQTELPTGGAA